MAARLEGTRLMRSKEGRSVLATEDRRVRREGDRTAIPAELRSEEHVVEVLVRVPGGDASYYFRVVVAAPIGAAPTATRLLDS